MTIRIGINGFGRIGRLAVRALKHQPGLELVHVNELKGGVETAAHLLEFDTVHGRYQGQIGVDASRLTIDGLAVTFSDHRAPGDAAGREEFRIGLWIGGDSSPNYFRDFDDSDGAITVLQRIRNGEFTVNIARIENGVPVIGVVYAPAIGRIFWGDIANGAAEGKVAADETIAWKKLLVRACPGDGAIVVASRSQSVSNASGGV